VGGDFDVGVGSAEFGKNKHTICAQQCEKISKIEAFLVSDSKPAIDCGISAPGLKDDGRPVNNLVRRTVKIRDL
jgi:hypothetical protein